MPLIGLLTKFGYLLIGWLLTMIPAFVIKAIASAGVGVVTFKGVNMLFTALKNQITTHFIGLGSSGAVYISNFLQMAQFGTCLNILFSAWTISLTLQAVNGVISRISFTNRNLS